LPKTRRVALVAALLAIAFAAAALVGSVRSGSTSSSKTAAAAAGTSGTATAAPVVNFRRLARKHRRAARILMGREFEALPPHWQQRQERLERLSAAGRVAAPRARTFRAEPSASPSPSLANNFDAVDDNNLFIPPDTEGAPGLDKLVVTVNGTVRIQQKSDGTVLSSVLLNSFFNGIPSVGTVFDPHVLYDPYTGRWIVVAVSDSTTANVLLAVSQSSDPSLNWNEYSIDADPTNQAWADYPTVGFNRNWIVVSVNMFAGNSFVRTQTYAFDKGKAYAGAGAGGGAYQVFTRLYATDEDFTLAPAATYDPNADDLYLTEDYDGTGTFSTLPLRLFKLSGPVGSATLTRLSDPSGSALTMLGHWSDVTAGSVGFAPQLGSNKPIDNGDARLTQCVYRNGAVWCANTVFLPSPSRSAVQWYEIDPATSRVLQAGRIQDATGVQFFAYPSIAVNKFNDALLGFSRFASNQYASADYAYRGCGDPANTFQDEAQYKAGAGSYFKTYSGTRNRWGDYSGTWVDPSDDASMWTIQEYAKAPPNSNSGTWGTWWGTLAPQFHAGPAPPSPASSDHTPGVSSGDQVVHVSWAPADDCAVKYVYKWSTNPGDVPDPATDPTAPASTTALASPALTPGSSWWLHLEALDGGGTASSVAQLGPFPIVSPPPPPPPPTTTTTTTTSPPPPPPVCVVPAVKGKTLAAASASLQAAHCKTGTITRRFSSTVRTGRVISQGIAAGAQRANGAAVSLVVSKGRAPFKPPVRVTICYRHHTLHVTRAVWRRLHKHGATLGRCRPRR